MEIRKTTKRLCGLALIVAAGAAGYYGRGALDTYNEPQKQFIIKQTIEEGVYKYPGGAIVYEKHEHLYRVLPGAPQVQQQTQKEPEYTPPPLTQKERRELPKQVNLVDSL